MKFSFFALPSLTCTSNRAIPQLLAETENDLRVKAMSWPPTGRASTFGTDARDIHIRINGLARFEVLGSASADPKTFERLIEYASHRADNLSVRHSLRF